MPFCVRVGLELLIDLTKSGIDHFFARKVFLFVILTGLNFSYDARYAIDQRDLFRGMIRDRFFLELFACDEQNEQQ